VPAGNIDDSIASSIEFVRSIFLDFLLHNKIDIVWLRLVIPKNGNGPESHFLPSTVVSADDLAPPPAPIGDSDKENEKE